MEIAFEDLGGAGGDPLLLVMGLGVSRFWWPQGLVDELTGHGFHVVASTSATLASPPTFRTPGRVIRSLPCSANARRHTPPRI